AHELGHGFGTEAVGGRAFAVHAHRKLGVGVAGVHAHVAQLLVAREQRHDVVGQLLEHFGRVADQAEADALAAAAHAAGPAEADLGPGRLGQALAQLFLQPLVELAVVGGQVQAGEGPALFAVAAVYAVDVETLAVGVDVLLDPRHLAPHLFLGVGALPLVVDVDLVGVDVVAAALGLGDRHGAGQADGQDPRHAPSAVGQRPPQQPRVAVLQPGDERRLDRRRGL